MAKRIKTTLVSPAAAILALEHHLYSNRTERNRLIRFILDAQELNSAMALVRLHFTDALKRYRFLSRYSVTRACKVVAQKSSAPQALMFLGALEPGKHTAAGRKVLLERVLRRPPSELKTRWYEEKLRAAKLTSAEQTLLEDRVGHKQMRKTLGITHQPRTRPSGEAVH